MTIWILTLTLNRHPLLFTSEGGKTEYDRIAKTTGLKLKYKTCDLIQDYKKISNP